MKSNENSEITDGILVAFLENDLAEDVRDQVVTWLEKSDVNRKEYERVKKAWELTAKIDPKPVIVNTEQAWDTVFDKITKKRNETPIVSLNTRRTNRKIYTGIAAMVIVLLGIFSVLKFMNIVGPDSIQVVAQTDLVIDELEDGSVVKLNPNSVLSYPERFEGQERRVSMSGEAFFEIARDEKKPFIIDLPNETYVKVLGTSFNIIAQENNDISQVEVITGKVAFGEVGNTIELLPGEIGKFNRKTGKLEKIGKTTEVDLEESKTISLDFRRTALPEVIDRFNSVHDMQIKLKCETVLADFWSVDLTGRSTDEVVQLLDSTFSLKSRMVTEENQTFYVLECED